VCLIEIGKIMLKYCFAPVVNQQTRILILGSLPGEASLAAQQYYAHPRNQFWPLLSHVLDIDLVTATYLERLVLLQKHGVGLWDVLAKASREGSLDGDIRHKHYNDLVYLLQTLPILSLIAFNGQTAGKAAGQLAEHEHIPSLILPSSSPAYTLSFAQKKEKWMQLRPYLSMNKIG
jgi:hypoxanthine-DNA glycosylase